MLRVSAGFTGARFRFRRGTVAIREGAVVAVGYRVEVRRSTTKYGISVFRNGVDLRGDGRLRFRRGRATEWGPEHARRRRSPRGKVGAWSEASSARLRFIAVNVDSEFKSLVTLTYRTNAESWESDAERNRRVIRRSQVDRHRFLRCLADEMGAYLWVREFQKRGVVHYHVITERRVAQERVTEAWVRASGQLDDEAVHRRGVHVDAIRSQGGALAYVSRYLGKERQKRLPAGVEGAGRWWGRSQSLKLARLADVVWLDRAEGVLRLPELRVVRILRRYISKCTGRPYRGGRFVDYGGRLSGRLAAMLETLKAYYGETGERAPMAFPAFELVGEEVPHVS